MKDKTHALPSIVAFKTLDALLASPSTQVVNGLPADCPAPPCWYALIDVSAHESLKHAKQALQALKADVSEWINLYDDLDGLELKEHGPRLAPLTITAAEQADVLMSTDALRGISLIAAHAPLRKVANHLLALREATLPDGSGALFRFQDTRVIAAMAPHLDNAQRAALLGPAAQWICCDVCGDLSRVVSATTKPGSAPLRLTAPVLAAVDAALLPHELLTHVREADSASLAELTECQQLRRARTVLTEGRARGLQTASDLKLYGVLAFQLPEDFPDKPPFDAAIRFAREGSGSFSQGLDRADPAAWARWNQWLSQLDGMSIDP